VTTEFKRPSEGFRFLFEGIKTNDKPDTFPPTKYPMAVNIRSYSRNQIRTRPGLANLFTAGSGASAPDLRAYTALATDDLPRILLRASDDTVWLDDGTQVGSLAGAGVGLGATLIPFRPNETPIPWMYIANGTDYQKFSAPNSSEVVTQQKVGIAEPQSPPEASFSESYQVLAGGVIIASGYTNAGTAGSPSAGVRSTDTVGTVLPDPIVVVGSNTYSFVVGATIQYQPKMLLLDSTSGVYLFVQDVFPAIANTTLAVAAIYYYTGTTGHCVVVTKGMSGGPGITDEAVTVENYLSSIRRGALIKIGTETVYVWSVTEGPDGSLAIETSTTANHVAGAAVTILPAIQVLSTGTAPTAGDTVAEASVTYAVTAGIGTETAAATNFFVSSGNVGFQSDDYVSVGVLIDTLANLTEMKILFDVSDGTFTKDYYYYSVRPSDIFLALENAATQLGTAQTAAQRAIIDALDVDSDGNEISTDSGTQLEAGNGTWTQLFFPISAMTRVGSDATKSLQTVAKVQFLWNCTATINVAHTVDITVIGTFQPDVGDVGAPYLYRVRPRSSALGIVGNPSPATRYGINPRRQAVVLTLPSAAYDPQIDTWDIFRFGGSVTSWRLIGTVASSTGIFVDNYSDDAANAGDALDFDNFEPWPSIDAPLNGTATVVVGYVMTAAITSPTNVLRYLPGTLVRVGGINVYTLHKRPTLVTSTTYRFEFDECADFSTGTPFYIQEPILALQPQAYMFGPDAAGTIFGCGDAIRPGTLSFTKSNAPDAVPDSYNVEIVPPSEPLLGGEILDGLGFVASPERWWALYPQPDNPTQRYNFVQTPDTRGLAAPFGHCNDGRVRYWYAKDGIYSSADGSLTDADLYTLFPHEGVPGKPTTYNGITIQPPDYAQAPKFRLSYANGYLYAAYPYIGGGGTYAPVLVCNLRTKAWSVDAYGGVKHVTNVYQIEQQAESSGVLNPVVLLVGTVTPTSTTSRVFVQSEFTNDNGVPIACSLGTFEFDGGDVRAPKQWGDVFLDCLPSAIAGIVVTPMSLGAGVAAPTTVPASASRVRLPISVGGIVVSDFLGLFASWTDDFTRQTKATELYLWQPSFVVQPAREISWTTFGSSFGLKGYLHLRQINLAWVSTAPVTLQATPFDGQAPAQITIPSSGGAYRKAIFVFTPNKGMLYSTTMASAAQFQVFDDDTELYVGQWGRDDPYSIFRGFGGREIDDAPI
jgi:hypothetical protein